MSSGQVFGRHPVKEVMRAGKRRIRKLIYARGSEKSLRDVLSFAAELGINAVPMERQQLDKMTGQGNHQGILIQADPVTILDIPTFMKKVKERPKPVVAVLDCISDPHNFGAILRSAETFGVAGVMYPKDRSADINSTVIKTSAGATEYLDFCRVTNLSRAINELRQSGFHVVATAGDGEISLETFNPLYPLAVVLGSEGKGVRPLVRKSCDESIRIPLKGRVSSLNVSTAAAVVFYQLSQKNS